MIGAATLGTYQIIQTHAHAIALSEHMTGSNPEIVDRIQAGAVAVAGVVTDPTLRAAEGGGLLSQAMMSEAAVPGL
ncbi:MAG: hypothetical protein WDN69_20695 [Aliidongia sp.]